MKALQHSPWNLSLCTSEGELIFSLFSTNRSCKTSPNPYDTQGDTKTCHNLSLQKKTQQ